MSPTAYFVLSTVLRKGGKTRGHAYGGAKEEECK